MCSAAIFVAFQFCFIFVHVPVRTGKEDKSNTCAATVRRRTEGWFECDRSLVYPMLASKTMNSARLTSAGLLPLWKFNSCRKEEGNLNVLPPLLIHIMY